MSASAGLPLFALGLLFASGGSSGDRHRDDDDQHDPHRPIRTPGRPDNVNHQPGQGHDPQRYAEGKRAALLRRARSPVIQEACRQFGGVFFPGMPVSMLVGFSASSTGPREQGGPPDYVRGELGMEDQWRLAHAGDATTRAALGRVVSALDGPSWWDDARGQWYLGLRRYSEALHSAFNVLSRARVPAWRCHDRGRGPQDAFDARCTVTVYSSGAGVLPTIMQRTDAIPAAGVDRWMALGELIAAQVRAGSQTVHGVRVNGKWKAAHAVLRAQQRLEAGRLVAQALFPSEVPWYPPPLPNSLVQTLISGAIS